MTSDQGARTIERLLGMPPKTIGAPLWVSGEPMHVNSQMTQSVDVFALLRIKERRFK